ncbi:MAG: hypothetical protein DI556_04790 [Rhodovulum sulfidophilum]|uniref:Secreted protein n=1 Tax=Rhodovulum sulfidophilum TaxID=35806 RepID=A0A2W5ND65_RHOSU|nr:MAG: hypothetical protein DI556_04790 [Rhodovulum sulfidophilum]
MRRLVLAPFLFVPLCAVPGPAAAQLAPGPDQTDTTRCAAYEALDDGGRVAALRGVEPFGDDIGAEDEQAARDWADEVARQCAGHPDRSLTEAATLANDTLTQDDD